MKLGKSSPDDSGIKINMSKLKSFSNSNDDLTIKFSSVRNWKNTYSLDFLLQQFNKKEQLEKGEEWYCRSCKKHVLALKKINIYKAPRNLVVHFKRLKLDEGQGPLISFPVRDFDLGPHVISKKSVDSYQIRPEEFLKPESLPNFEIIQKYQRKWKLNKEGLVYDLRGIVNHVGSQSYGHYTANCEVEGQWHNFDDSYVSKVGEDALVSEKAYILFYELKGG